MKQNLIRDPINSYIKVLDKKHNDKMGSFNLNNNHDKVNEDILLRKGKKFMDFSRNSHETIEDNI